jgi:hypothetical protein
MPLPPKPLHNVVVISDFPFSEVLAGKTVAESLCPAESPVEEKIRSEQSGHCEYPCKIRNDNHDF